MKTFKPRQYVKCEECGEIVLEYETLLHKCNYWFKKAKAELESKE